MVLESPVSNWVIPLTTGFPGVFTTNQPGGVRSWHTKLKFSSSSSSESLWPADQKAVTRHWSSDGENRSRAIDQAIEQYRSTKEWKLQSAKSTDRSALVADVSQVQHLSAYGRCIGGGCAVVAWYITHRWLISSVIGLNMGYSQFQDRSSLFPLWMEIKSWWNPIFWTNRYHIVADTKSHKMNQ